MAQKIWSSLTDDWLGATAWRLATTGATSAVAAADDLTIPATATVTPAVNLGHATTIASEYHSLTIQEGCQVNVGGVGNPLKCTFGSGATGPELPYGYLRHFGNGTVFFDSQEATNKKTDAVIINSPNNVLAASVTANGASDPGRLVVVRGKVEVAASITRAFESVEVHYRNSPGTDADLIIHPPAVSALTFPLLKVYGGKVQCNHIVTTIIQGGGKYTQDKYRIFNLYLTGGTCYYNTPFTVDPTGVLDNAHVGGGGTLELRTDSEGNYSSSCKQINNLYRYGGGIVRLIDGIHNITNDFDTTGYGKSSTGGGGIG